MHKAAHVSLSPILHCIAQPSKPSRHILVANVDNATVSLDAQNGGLLWSHRLEGPAYGSPLLEDSMVFVGTAAGVVVALQADSGEVLWQRQTNGSIVNAPRLVKGSPSVLVVTSGQRAVGLMAATGRVLWVYTANDDMVATAAVSHDGSKVFVGSEDGVLVALLSRTGAKVWDLPLKGNLFGVQTTPIVHGRGSDEVLYVAPQTGMEVFKVNATDGSLDWTFASYQQQFSRPGTISSQLLHVGPDNLLFSSIFPEDHPPGPRGLWFSLYRLNTSTGRVVWNTSRPTGLNEYDVPCRPPVVVEDHVVVAAEDGVMESFDWHTGRLTWRKHFSNSPAGGTLAGTLLPLPEQKSVLILNGTAAVAMDIETGATSWQVPLKGQSRAPFATMQKPFALFLAGDEAIVSVRETEHLFEVSAENSPLV